MARARPHEEHVNHERWLVSYADFITLLFAFFVVMYSTSSVNEGKMRVLSDSLIASFAGRNKSLNPIQIGELVRSPYVDDKSPVTSAQRFVIVAPPNAVATLDQKNKPDALEAHDGYLGGIQTDAVAGKGRGRLATTASETPGGRSDTAAGRGPGGGGPDDAPYRPPEISGTPARPGEPTSEGQAAALGDVSQLAEAVRQSMGPLIDLQKIALKQKESWMEIVLDSSKLFVSGSARIARAYLPTLAKIAAVLKRFSNPIQVEGFTDNVPIQTLAYPSNWELSAARAASVVHLFTEEGIDPERLIAVGYGEHRPVADNATPEGRARNRRVVIVVPADREIRRILRDRTELSVVQQTPLGEGQTR